MKPTPSFVTLAGIFGLLSLISFGGTNAVVPEMHRQFIDNYHWISGDEFAAFYAVAQVAPGPNFLFVTLIGWRVAGIPGAIIATLSVVIPAWILTSGVLTVWDKFREARWRLAVQAGITPVTLGLIMASGALIARSADHVALAWMMTAATAVILLRFKLNPLWIFGAGAVLGAVCLR